MGTPWKPVIVEQLETLASEEEQLGYERNVPHVDITAELVCGWFDDTYHPDAPEFRACFSNLELQALSEFNAVYEQIRRVLPPSNGTVKTWLSSPHWRHVMQAASQALRSLAG